MRTTTALVCLAAAAPFVPAAWQAAGGVPEMLYTGYAPPEHPEAYCFLRAWQPG